MPRVLLDQMWLRARAHTCRADIILKRHIRLANMCCVRVSVCARAFLCVCLCARATPMTRFGVELHAVHTPSVSGTSDGLAIH